MAVADEAPDEARCWALLLAIARRGSSPLTWSWADGQMSPAVQMMHDLYLPLCEPEHLVVGHLAQTLDGRIATGAGKSQFISGKESLLHAHRLRALFDVVVVGRRTIQEDDPLLTTRLCTGPSPVRVVIDPERRLDDKRRVFTDQSSATLLFCSADATKRAARHGHAEVVGIPAEDGALPVTAILAELARRRLRRIFIEGGGLTVSSFLAARALHRLHLTVSPVIFGSGRPSVTLPEIRELAEARSLPFRHFSMGRDVLFDCAVPA